MALKKLSLKRIVDEEPEIDEAPKKTLLKKKIVEETPELPFEEAEEEEAPKKKVLLTKKAVVEEEAEEEEAEEEEAEEEAPKKKVLLKKKLGGGPAAVEEVEEEEAEEEAAPAPKKLLTKKAVVDEEVEEAEEEAPKKKVLARKGSAADTDDAPAVTRELVAYEPQKFGTIDGPVDERDLMRPRINMVQANSSDLEEKGFSVGQIVLNGETLIWEKGFDTLNVILLTGRKKFIQKLSDDEYKEGITPLIFDSAEKAEEAGYSTQWEGDEPPTVDPALYCLFLLEQPDYIEDDPMFSLEYGQRKFALAEMKFSGVNYRAATAGKWLLTQTRTGLAPDSRFFMLAFHATREKQKKSGNIVTTANFKNLGKHKDEKFTEWVLSLG
jgi:hypothetical protein